LEVRTIRTTPIHPEVDIYNDDFFTGIFEFQKYLDNLRKIDHAIEEVFAMREEYIVTLTFAGLDPFANATDKLTNDNKTNYDYVKRCKRCVYEGFKMNLLQKITDGDGNSAYYTLNGIKIELPHFYTDNYYLYNELLFKDKRDTYKFTVSKLCKIEGWVNIDTYVNIACI